MSNLKILIEKIKSLNNSNNLPSEIKIRIGKDIKHLFPILNKNHYDLLKDLTIYLTETIRRKFLYSVNNNQDLVRQFTMNNSRDLKAIILMLLPFIDDKENHKKYKMIRDLNQIIYNVQNTSFVNKSILEKDIVSTLKNEFLISNFGIGLLHQENKESILDLKNNTTSIIEEIIYHNFIGLLETLRMTTSKLYVNWINTIPISEDEFEEEYELDE